MFKHCYPVCDILYDIYHPDVDSPFKRLENYKLQYLALKQKMHEFHKTKFLLWTGAAQVEKNITKEKAERTKTFFVWVRTEWDTHDDNIFSWNFFGLETEGTLYMKKIYSINSENSHSNQSFAKRLFPLFCHKIVEVIEQNK